MENRRPTSPNTPKTFNARKNFQKSETRNSFGERFSAKDENLSRQPNRFQIKNEKFAGKNEKYTSPNNRLRTKNRPVAPKGKYVKPWQKQDRPSIVSDMQVTDGKFVGKYLQSSASPKVRTTSRRIREVMFRILQRRIRAGRFLDLCAGAGTIGIEAISRGALIGTFVERSAKMCSFIKKNLAAFNIKEGHGEIFEMEVIPFLKKTEKRRRVWDLVFFDPPHAIDYDEVLQYLRRGITLKPKGVLIIEHPAEMFFPEKIGVLNRWRVVTQDETALSFYERK